MRDHPRGHHEPREPRARVRAEGTDGVIVSSPAATAPEGAGEPSEGSPSSRRGTLYVVATPIGNLEDITARALRVLREVDLVACEDTRRTRALLTHFDLHTPTLSYHEHNKLSRGPQLLRQLAEGKSVALVTDAGTPGVSDPGFMLVRDAWRAGVPVVPVPGPSAVATALSAAGLPADRFVFDGFLPVKAGKRLTRLRALKDLHTTVVLYESPHRIVAALEAIRDVFGDDELVVARELTKHFEEIVRATPAAHLARLRAGAIRGEFTLVLAAPRGARDDMARHDEVAGGDDDEAE